MSCGTGPCFRCQTETGRFDSDKARFVCWECHPHPLNWVERSLLDGTGPGRRVDPEPEPRLPGESRQEWRRRMRGRA